MTDSPFLYWKNPGKKEVFTIRQPQIKKISDPAISQEGFLLFPYDKNESGYFLSGQIEQTTELIFPDLLINPANRIVQDAPENYKLIVNKSVAKIKNYDLKKVVLARSAYQNLQDNFNLKTYFESICNTYNNVFVYCIGFENEIWIGATPEIFLANENDSFLTYALAGTKPLNSEITFGEKEKNEQQLVKNYILDLLKHNNADLVEISEMTELNTGNLIHLINKIKFKTTEPLEIIHKLHPTPAICGTPLIQAADFIRENENLDREFYSGFLGPVFKNNDFSFWVNLRCAKIKEGIIKFYAGAGIIKDSVAQAEWDETERKIDTLRSLL